MAALLLSRVGGLWPLALVSLCALLTWALVRPRIRRSARMRVRSPAGRSVLTDLGYVVLGPVTELLTRTLTSAGIVACAWLVGMQLGVGLLDGFGPLSRQPRWLVVLEMLVVGDLIYYWTHRLAHSVPFLWRLHAVHHCTEHMRCTSALRSHPAEAYVLLLNHVPLFLLGFPVDALIPLTPPVTLYAMWIHSSGDAALRPISYLANSPRFHRWHHARDVAGSGVNFAGLFPAFDALFGTYHLPDGPPAAVGIAEPMPADLLGQLRYPFRGRQARRARRRRRSLGAALGGT